MTINTRNKNGMWDYLESVGVLEKGTEEDIKKAKKEFQRKYILEYKRKERASNSEFIVLLSKQNGELKAISDAAQVHKSSISKFLKDSALAYLEKRFLVPDSEKVALLELTLSDCRNQIQKISKNTILSITERIQAIEKRIETMESAINELFRHPNEIP
jgi:hypothetical protein